MTIRVWRRIGEQTSLIAVAATVCREWRKFRMAGACAPSSWWRSSRGW